MCQFQASPIIFLTSSNSGVHPSISFAFWLDATSFAGSPKRLSPIEVDEKLQTATPILENMLDYAVEKGMIEDTTTERDLFDTKIMNALMPSHWYYSMVLSSRMIYISSKSFILFT